MGIIFVIGPMLIRLAIFNWRIPLPLVLQPLLIGVIVFLLWDPTFRMGSEVTRLFSWRTLVSILTIFADMVAILGGYLVAVLTLDVSSHTFTSGLRLYFKVQDVFSGLFKAFFCKWSHPRLPS